MDQINYQSYSDNTGFRPITEPDLVPGLQANAQNAAAAERAYATALANNNRIRVGESKKVGQDLLELSKFSKKLTEVATQVYKQTEDDILVGELYDALMNPGYLESDESQQEQATIQQQSQTADLAAGAVAEAEQSGQPVVAAAIRTDANLSAQGFKGERAALMQAQTTYGPWMAAYTSSDAIITINGQQMTMREAMSSGNPAITSAAVAQARYEFISSNGLAGATKRQFVRFMRGVMPNVDSQLTQNALTTATKGQREEARSQLDGTAYTISQNTESTPEALQETWNQLAERYWQEGGYATRGEANQAALQGMIKGLVARGDVEGIERLRDVLKVEGQDGTQLGNQYGELIDSALQDARARRTSDQRAAQGDVMASMYEQLSDENLTPAQRDVIIENTARQLEANGNYQEARQLRQDRDDLTVDGSSQRNAAELSTRIAAGEIVSSESLTQQLQLGNITPGQYSQLLGELQATTGREAPDNEFASDLVRRELAAFETDFLEAVGIKRDAGGRLIATTTGETALVSAGDAERIVAQAEADLNLLVNAELNRLGPGATDAEVRAAVSGALATWRQQEVQGEGGRYRVDDILEARRGTSGQESVFADNPNNQAWRTRFSGLLNVDAGAYVPPGYSERVDYSDRTTSGGWTPQNAGEYSGLRGDIVIPRQTLTTYREQYEAGEIGPELQSLADTLGLSPLALLQQQSGAYGLRSLDPFANTGTDVPSTGPVSMKEGAQLIMKYGVPARGAAWLSGNIQQESSWNGQRTWGEVLDDGSDRNGGLVSWMDGVQHNNSRLTLIEDHLGKPITEASNQEQVAAMLWEMKTYYPDAYATFMNPYATDRQLVDASINYWGYGHEGDRYEYARQIEQQITG